VVPTLTTLASAAYGREHILTDARDQIAEASGDHIGAQVRTLVLIRVRVKKAKKKSQFHAQF
jgi:hypothetical protein